MKEALKSPLPIVIIKEWGRFAIENNGLKAEDRRQKQEVRGLRSEVRGQKAEGRRPQ